MSDSDWKKELLTLRLEMRRIADAVAHVPVEEAIEEPTTADRVAYLVHRAYHDARDVKLAKEALRLLYPNESPNLRVGYWVSHIAADEIQQLREQVAK